MTGTSDEGPQFCECAQCEFDEPAADLGYLLYSDPDYLTKRQSTSELSKNDDCLVDD